ncbi:hypothetical protein [Mycolicibacterium sp. F2034L]|uniref:hypothetical protein n=1 Tax=Mycolicibacterium sp. F2034L TaxID=2926422 RepID=UPI001FF61A59|nr:hypothetical protein [Mycolicibacterium sp. F2034L]MCK0172796.1 hypothetical protein [Mycolicibacterium sp. F2034L]
MRAPSAAVAAVIALAVGTALTPPAGARPADFPDLGRFSSADPTAYMRPFSPAERWATGYLFFQTPGGVNCAAGAATWCTGPLPGVPVPPGGCGSVDADGGGFQIRTTRTPCVPGSPAVLNAGEKLTNDTYDIVCAVGAEDADDADDMVACIRGDGHGFVLQPSGSRTF